MKLFALVSASLVLFLIVYAANTFADTPGAKHDILEKESNTADQGLRDRAIHHLDEALKRIEESLKIKK